MARWLLAPLGAALLIALDAGPLFAETTGWPAFSGGFTRGAGYYLSVWKIMSCWVVFAAWASTTDWVSQDCKLKKQNALVWVNTTFFSFVLAFLLVWVIPWFALGFILLLIAYIAPLSTYIVLRNKQMSYDEKVLTPEHLRRWFADKVSKVGVNVSAEKKTADEMGPDVKITPLGGASERDNSVSLLTARQSPGFPLTRILLDDALKRRAENVLLDYTEQAVAVRYQIDGVWHNVAQQERVPGDAILEVLKTVSTLNPTNRRARQAGSFEIEAGGKKLTGKLVSQGTETGERAVLTLVEKKSAFKSLDDLGMRGKMQEELLALTARKNGFILACSQPSGGLTTTFDIMLRATDRFMRNWVSIEDAAKRENDIENVTPNLYDSAAGQTPEQIMPKLLRTYPDVLVVRDIVNAEMGSILCESAKEERLVFSTVRAKEAVEALLRVLLLKIPPPEFAAVATAVLNERLIRKLCEKCKEAYAPPPEVLKRLGIPAGRIEALYRTPTVPIDPKHPEIVCDACQGIGYLGRTAIFELLTVDDTMRQVLAKQPKLDLLREAARRAKHRSLQEEGIVLVARGVTSIEELLRVLK